MSQNKSKKYPKKRRKQYSSWLTILSIVAGALLISLAFFALREKPTPKAPIEVKGSTSLKVDKEKIDLGDVKLGQTVEVTFQLANVGDKPLRFSKQPFVEVVAGC
jgi:hypothetical protein